MALTQRVIAALLKRRQGQREERLKAGASWRNELDLIFTTRTGTPLDGVNVTRDFQRMLKRADLPVKRFHDLRHTAASFLLYRNVQSRVVMDRDQMDILLASGDKK